MRLRRKLECLTLVLLTQGLAISPVLAQEEDLPPPMMEDPARPSFEPPQAPNMPGLDALRRSPGMPQLPNFPRPSANTPVPNSPFPASRNGVVSAPNLAPLSPSTAPSTMPSTAPTGPVSATEDGIYLNAVDTDIREIIKQIAKVTGKNFLVDQRIRGKITIVSEKKMTIEEAYQSFLSSLEVLGFTVVQAPGNLIKVVPMKSALQQPLPIYKDNSPITDAFITRLIQMRNISALDMSNAIKDLVSKDGNLFAYPATNTLIVTDTGSNIERLLKIIRELDQEGPSDTIQIIPLKFANAKDVANQIGQLYEQEEGGSLGAARGGVGRPGIAGAPVRRTRAAAELEETPYLSKVIPDERTNSVIVLASKRAIVKVKELVARLDHKLEDGAEGKIHVHYLKHADAKELASVLSTLAGGTTTSATATRTQDGNQSRNSTSSQTVRTASGATASLPPLAEFEGGIKVAADENTNALIITATAKDYKTLADEVINMLDIPRKQVYVEVIIMELTIDKNRALGFSGQGGSLLQSLGVGGNPALAFGSSLGGTAAGLSAAALSGLAAGVVSTNTTSVPVTGSDGSVTNLEVPTFGAILTALQNDTNVNILSTPNLLTMDNEEAEIVVGQEQPFPTGSTLTDGGNKTFNVTREDVGITLKMTPQINEGDTVKIKLKQEVAAVIGGASDAILQTVGPSTTKRSVETVVAAKDQQTIVIGGLIDDKVTATTKKVPFLGDIPVLGNLFKQTSKTKAKTNILVFLRPYIIRDTKDFQKILQKKVEERNMFISQNYGKRQQEVIRQSIQSHAADLLQFRKEIQRQDWDFNQPNSLKTVKVNQDEGTPLQPNVSGNPQDHQERLIQAGKVESDLR